jgi:DNA (cytosine-5)-methyltransferase 1
MKDAMRVIDIFAGCGGMSLGFQNAGFDICAAFDNWKPAIEVYKKNFTTHDVFEMDLSESNSDVSLFSSFKPDVIIGGPPCQDFSSAGKRDESLGRADLTIVFANIVGATLPRWFVMENVDRAIKSKAYTSGKRFLEDVGYGLTEKILDASFCGVPQTRKRLFLIGELNGQSNGVDYYLEKNMSSEQMTVRDYLGDKLGIENYYRHPRSYKRRGVFSINEPSPTIRGVNRPIPSTYKNHVGDTAPVTSELRPLTTKERSLIQTFPNDFIFEGSKSDVEQMIGNAVPVKLAEYVARCILEYIEKGFVIMSAQRKAREQLSFF